MQNQCVFCIVCFVLYSFFSFHTLEEPFRLANLWFGGGVGGGGKNWNRSSSKEHKGFE